MKLTEILPKDRIIPRLDAREKALVLHELVHNGFLGGRTRGLDDDDEDRLVKVLEERERLGSTGIKDGLAIPHGKVSGLPDLSACLGLCPEGIAYGAFDGELSRVFLVLLSPETCGSEHLKALARISRLFSAGHLQRRLMEPQTADEIFEILAAEDARL